MKLATPRQRSWRYYRNLLIFTLGSVLVAAYVILPIGFAVQDVRPPARFAVCCVSPADLGLPYEDVTFRTSDGLILSGWYIPSRNGAAIIAAHARNGNRTSMIYHAGFLAQHGYGVLLFDLRGHGDSEGKLWLYGWQGHRDVLGALAYLQNRSDVAPNRIGAVGLSAGGEAVLHAAAVNDQIKAVVSDGLIFVHSKTCTWQPIRRRGPMPLGGSSTFRRSLRFQGSHLHLRWLTWRHRLRPARCC
jgi:pimeloyl-ACP methyl ester carboxylesterase